MELQINARRHEVDADSDTPLLWVIRDELGMTGTKYGCGLAQCGACSVLVDGQVVRSCVTPVAQVEGKAITTIEAIEDDPVGQRVVAAWVAHQVPQCGYCQSGQVIAATALLRHTPHPSDAQIVEAMTNLCRCGTYNAIKAAVHDLANNSAGAPPRDEHASSSAGHGPAIPKLAAAAVAVAGIGSMVVGRASAEASNSNREDDHDSHA